MNQDLVDPVSYHLQIVDSFFNALCTLYILRAGILNHARPEVTLQSLDEVMEQAQKQLSHEAYQRVVYKIERNLTRMLLGESNPFFEALANQYFERKNLPN